LRSPLIIVLFIAGDGGYVELINNGDTIGDDAIYDDDDDDTKLLADDNDGVDGAVLAELSIDVVRALFTAIARDDDVDDGAESSSPDVILRPKNADNNGSLDALSGNGHADISSSSSGIGDVDNVEHGDTAADDDDGAGDANADAVN
jgi:hypothetical protein